MRAASEASPIPGLRALALALLAVLSILGCASSAGDVGPHTPATGDSPRPGMEPVRATGATDCRTSGCGPGETCHSPGGCGVAWVCEACATGIVMEPNAYCGCDGQTHTTNTVGCRAFEHAHVGPC